MTAAAGITRQSGLRVRTAALAMIAAFAVGLLAGMVVPEVRLEFGSGACGRGRRGGRCHIGVVPGVPARRARPVRDREGRGAGLAGLPGGGAGRPGGPVSTRTPSRASPANNA